MPTDDATPEPPREVEAKFTVPDASTFARLRAARTLGGLAVGPLKTGEVQDRYLDTADSRFLRRRLVCRIREKSARRIATLKGLDSTSVTAGVHNRSEVEADVPGDDPAGWPPGPARDLALAVSGGAPLAELFRLRQIRHVGALTRDGRPVAELSLDEVYLDAGAPTYGLEAELQPGADPAALTALAADLQAHWHLPIQHLSKFEQAWTASGRPPPGGGEF